MTVVKTEPHAAGHQASLSTPHEPNINPTQYHPGLELLANQTNSITAYILFILIV